MIGLGLRLGMSGALWTPTKLGTSVQLWLRADTVTLNGSAVSSWTDLSANGNALAQADAAKQPTYNASDANFGSKPSVQFDGTADALAKSGCTFATRSHGHALVMAMRLHSVPAANQRIFSADVGVNDYDNVDSFNFISTAANYASIGMQRAFASQTNLSNTTAPALSTARIVTIAFAAGTVIMRVNGTQLTNTDAYADVTNLDYTRITLGAIGGGAANWSPLVTAEVLLTHIGAVTDTSIRSVERYMGRRYGIAVA